MELVKRCHSNGFNNLIAEFVPTKQNTVAENFLGDHGFRPLESETDIIKKLKQKKMFLGGKVYIISTINPQIPNSDLFESLV